MDVQPYNADVVLDLVAEHLRREGRGAQTRLAGAVGVRVQTVNKWAKRQTCPEPDKWPAIEQYFGLEHGTIARLSGLNDFASATDGDGSGPSSSGGEIRRLREEVAELRAIVESLRGTPADVPQEAHGSR